MFRTRIADDGGQDLIEYALLVSGIALMAIAAVNAFGVSAGQLWLRIGAQLAAIFQ
jgi:Flp pilus assembly pilin Flp